MQNQQESLSVSEVNKIEESAVEGGCLLEEFNCSFEYFEESFRETIAVDKDRLCKYGVEFLDEMLYGIWKKELVIIGSWSGVGKSALADMIARVNAKNGKRVAYFRLEGDKDEFARLQLWNTVAKEYYKHNKYVSGETFNYHKFCANDLPGIEAYLRVAKDEQINDLKKLFLFDNTKVLTKDSFDYHMGQLHLYNFDLVVIDHLHYFTMWDNENENEKISKLMRTIKNLNREYKLPVVLVVHLRKKMDRKQLIPSMDDFMGTSNIAKEADTMITLAPDYTKYDPINLPFLYPTILRLAKNRMGYRPHEMAILNFDGIKKEYDPNYERGMVINYGEDYKLYSDMRKESEYKISLF